MNRRITIFIFMVCMLGYSFDMFSQGGINCKSPVIALPGTNVATQGVQQFYKFTSVKNEVVTLSSCNSTVAYTIAVTQDSCNGGVVNTVTGTCSSGTNKQVSFIANGGSTYIFSWFFSGPGSQTIDWTLATADLTSGSSCQNAITAVIGASNVYNSTGPLPIWYSYTATKDARIEISTVSHNYTTKVRVFGSCNPQDTIDYIQTNAIGSVGVLDLVYFYVNAGQTVYFCWNNPNSGDAINFDFDLEEITPTAGETCDQAIALTNGINSVSSRYPTWFSYSNPNSTAMKVSVMNDTGIYVEARESCGLTDFERSVKHFSDDLGNPLGNQFEALPASTSGKTYTMEVFPSSRTTVTGSISVPNQGESCDNPFTAVDGINYASDTANTDQWYTYTPAHNGWLRLTSDSSFWNKIQVRFSKGCTLNPYLIGVDSTEVTAGTPILICLRGLAFSSYTFYWNLSLRQVPDGSDMSSAILAVPGTNDGGGSSGIWYKYSPTVNSYVDVSTCGTNSVGPTYVELFDQNGYYLSADDGSCYPLSNDSILVEGGATIYIEWFGGTINNWNLTSNPTGTSMPAGYSCSNPVTIASTGAQSTVTSTSTQAWVWYSYTAPSDGILSVDNCGNSLTSSTKAYITNNCVVSDPYVLSFPTACGTYGSGTSATLTSGETVYIAWWQAQSTGTFNWNLNFTPSTAIPQGYSCNNPIAAILGSNIANTLTGNEIFTYTPTSAGHLQISTVGSFNKPVLVSIYKSCDDYLAISQMTNENNPYLTKTLTSDSLGFDCGAGQTYYIVWSKGYTSSDFSWNLSYSVLSSNAEITGFSIPGQESSSATINSAAGTVELQMPYNTDLSTLAPDFVASGGSTLQVNSVVQSSGITSNNFTNPVAYTVTAQDGTTKDWTVTVSDALNHAAEITSYQLNGVDGVINSANGTITVTLPYGTTSVTGLVPVIGLSAQATIDSTGKHDFTSPVSYTVTAEDNTTTKDWTVTVSVAHNTAAEITSYKLDGVDGVINSANGTIDVSLPYGTSVTDLVPVLNLSGQATIDSTGKHDFTSPVNYTVTAGDQTTTKIWTVTVTIAANTAAEITSFKLDGVDGVINSANGTIDVSFPYGASVTGLVPVLSLSAQATIDSTGKHDFTSPVSYTVTAGDQTTTKTWMVTVSVAHNTAAEITSFKLDGVDGVINSANGTIDVSLPYGTSVTDLVPVLNLSGQATIDSTGKHDFTSPVSYTVTAGDQTTTKTWTVTVTIAANTAAEITSFKLDGVDGVIDSSNGTIDVLFPYGASVTDLVPILSLSAQATIDSTGKHDFTSPVSYAVTAGDQTTTKTWTVTVTVAKNNQSYILSFSVPGQLSASIDTTDKTIAVKVPVGTNLTNLVATFELSPGATAKVGNVAQVSATTANDFSSSVTYLVTAENGVGTSTWTVTVTPNTAVLIAQAQDFKVYPVPSTGLVKIDVPENGQGVWSVQLINTEGQVVYSKRQMLNEGTTELDLSNSVSGIYSLVLSNGNQTITKKVVINK